jgi:hypothetical protein
MVVKVETTQHDRDYPFTIDLDRIDGDESLFAWSIKLAVNDRRYGKYYGAFLTPFQALELAAELARMAGEQMREYAEGAEKELASLREKAEGEW